MHQYYSEMYPIKKKKRKIQYMYSQPSELIPFLHTIFKYVNPNGLR